MTVGHFAFLSSLNAVFWWRRLGCVKGDIIWRLTFALKDIFCVFHRGHGYISYFSLSGGEVWCVKRIEK